MSRVPALDDIVRVVEPLVVAGAALHWLVPRDKMPIAKDWSSKPVYTVDDLRSIHRRGANIGLRTGEPSKIDGSYLHVLDLDIRKSESAPAAWEALLRLMPSARSMPSVITGSGGESRHIYFLSTEPLRSKTLVKSPGFEMVRDSKKDRDVKKFDWQIEIKGSGTQVAIPPSIHPSGQPYRWEQPLDLDFPMLMQIDVSAWNVAVVHKVDFDEDDLESLMRQEPLDIDEDEVLSILEELPPDWYDDRELWLNVGMALHHQFRGSDRGFNIWCDWSEQSPKFNEKDSIAVWMSFRGATNPKTFRTLINARNVERSKNEFEFDFDAGPSTTTPATIKGDLSDLLGDDPPPAAKAVDHYDVDWVQRLHRNEEGELKSTLPNVALIIDNDPRTAGIVAFNEFKHAVVLRGAGRRALKKRESGYEPTNLEGRLWEVKDTLNGDNWTDFHDIAIRAVIESKTQLRGYGIKVTDRDLRGGIDMSAQRRSFHPVKELLQSTVWDGKPRAERMFIEYLGCEDNAYYRQASLMTLVGAIARIYQPGHKFDFVPILEGTQGKGKSTFIRILSLGWFNELAGDISDPKQMIEVMQGTWILEIGELSAMQRHEVNDLKAFVSRTHDKARLAFFKRVGDYPRQCIFIGSTNDREYLRDQTGGRRFWPIVCNIDGQIDNPRFRREIMQIWAEALVIYRRMEAEHRGEDLPLFLSDNAGVLALEMQESRRVETVEEMLAGKIQAWLDTPLAAEFEDLDENAPKQYRQDTCVAQIWEEMMGREGSIPHTEAIKIGKAMLLVGWKRSAGIRGSYPINKRYGKCRVYFRP